MKIFNIDHHIQKLVLALEFGGWTKNTVIAWKDHAPVRLSDFIRNNAHTDIAQHVVENALQNIHSVVSQEMQFPPCDFGVEYSSVFMNQPLQLMLIPAYFVQYCAREVDRLTQSIMKQESI